MEQRIPLSKADVTEAEASAVADVVRSGQLAMGPRLARFEELVAERAGRRHGVGVASGTAGLHLALIALGVGPGDEVVTTPFSYIASANAIRYVGATPVFVDIDPRSLNMDPEAVEAAIGERTKAILGVEVFGNPAHMDRLAAIARRSEIPLVEDACEAIGGAHAGHPVGSFGRVAVFGFYPNKQITTGEGGMLVTDDDRIAAAARSLRNQGRSDARGQAEAGPTPPGSWLEHGRLGYNYRLSEIAAALGIVQMERLEELLEKRRRIAAGYMRRLMDWEDLVLPNVPDDAAMSWFVFVVRLSAAFDGAARDRILSGLNRHEVGAGNYFPCIHRQPPYRDDHGREPGTLPIAESVAERTIALPFHTALDATQLDQVCQTLRIMLDREKQ